MIMWGTVACVSPYYCHWHRIVMSVPRWCWRGNPLARTQLIRHCYHHHLYIAPRTTTHWHKRLLPSWWAVALFHIGVARSRSVAHVESSNFIIGSYHVQGRRSGHGPAPLCRPHEFSKHWTRLFCRNTFLFDDFSQTRKILNDLSIWSSKLVDLINYAHFFESLVFVEFCEESLKKIKKNMSYDKTSNPPSHVSLSDGYDIPWGAAP